jgi:hypothetical protein
MKLQAIMSDTTRKYRDFVVSDRPIPTWLQRQVAGVYALETNYSKGLSILSEGIEQEREVYADLYKELTK